MTGSSGLAYKAYEIEELADIYFFRRLGYIVAHAARLIQLTPNAVSIAAALVGVAGGALLYWPRLALVGFGLLVLHGVVDSADGQLARMTNNTSELGRILDGVSGYVTHVAIFVAVALASMAAGASGSILLWAAAAGVSAAMQAQMYDYHRDSYARCVIRGTLGAQRSEAAAQSSSGMRAVLQRLAVIYGALQRRLAGVHPEVEEALRRRAHSGQVRAEDRARYRASYYWPVRGWNVLGDNV
ncbi:MAG: CDP-alcohol phosphatidyltransferase family protein, partial [Vicinamibacterales bacterium]